MSAFDKKVASIISIRPLSAEKGAKLEFRISKNGSSVIVRPMVKVDFGGRMIMLPLNKLKEGRSNVSNALNGSSEQPMPVNPYSGGGTTGGDNW